MIYRSNLTAPDLSPHFKQLLVRPRPWSLGHDIPSDPDYEPENCFMSHDEAAILWQCAYSMSGDWVDIGARFGWSTIHVASAGCNVVAVDHVLKLIVAQERLEGNLHFWWHRISEVISKSSSIALAQLNANNYGISDRPVKYFAGFCIDANHDSPEPTNDARGCLKIAAPDCCIVFHDFRGRPIRDAVRFLMGEGFRARVYWTPSMMAVCWRGNFVPPVHVRDPKVDWVSVRRGAKIDEDFDLARCE